jgi:hypothetical protein
MRTTDPQIGVAFFFFRFDDEQKSSAADMLASLIKQLCECRPDTPEAVQNLRMNHGKGHIPTLETTLEASIKGITNVYLIIDALDECLYEKNLRKNVLDSLRRVHRIGLQNLHLMCASRREDDIEEVLKPLLSSELGKSDVDLGIQESTIISDISVYIETAFTSESFESWETKLKDEVKVKLLEKADGM